MEPITLTLLGLSFALGVGALGLRAWRRNRRSAEVLESGNPAFRVELSMTKLEADPTAWKARLAGKIVRVCSTTVTTFADRGDHVSTHFNSFVIDSNGETHDLETSADQVAVERRAKWTADLFGVEYEVL